MNENLSDALASLVRLITFLIKAAVICTLLLIALFVLTAR